MKLENKVAIVTGAGRGIGQAIAVAFAREGAHVVLAARTRSQLEDTATRCREAGGTALPVVVDVANWEQVQHLVKTALKDSFGRVYPEPVEGLRACPDDSAGSPRRLVEGTSSGRVDILVNSAGVYGPIGPTSEIDTTAWTRAVEINLFGPLYLCRAVMPHMMERRQGKIILLGGGGATAPLPNFSSYAAAKAGVVRLADTLAEELKEYNVHVNVIAPGLVDTQLQDDVLAAGRRAGSLLDKIKQARERGVGAVSPALAAALAVFLASDDSDGLTGKLIAAPYDDWQSWDADRIAELMSAPWLTLRRMDPFTIKPLVED